MSRNENKINDEALSKAAKSLPLTSEVDMRIARDGRWYHDGGLINRLPLVRLFSTVLKQDEDGGYWLITPVEKARIVVEDVPFTIVEMKSVGAGKDQKITFRNNVDTWFEFDQDHPIRIEYKDENESPTPYILVRERLEGRILRSVYYQLAELAVEQNNVIGVWSHSMFHVLGDIE
ncbi:DUF1285 domain-containing protein [Kiloniella antarctica]|uniref:DUF1285 domain-containing protein n=1 Tax=Kiloniella antarctica TaxID=1550907 RepID=A0ABW5BHE1_9PROT